MVVVCKGLIIQPGNKIRVYAQQKQTCTKINWYLLGTGKRDLCYFDIFLELEGKKKGDRYRSKVECGNPERSFLGIRIS